jgi:hypothetical protein
MRIDVFDDYKKPPAPVLTDDELRTLVRFLTPCFECVVETKCESGETVDTQR